MLNVMSFKMRAERTTCARHITLDWIGLDWVGVIFLNFGGLVQKGCDLVDEFNSECTDSQFSVDQLIRKVKNSVT